MTNDETIRADAIEAAAKYQAEVDYDAWSCCDNDDRARYRETVTPLVDAVLAVTGPAYRAEGVDVLGARLREYAQRPPVWGPNERGDLMLDMSADDLRGDVEALISEARGEPRPTRKRPDRATDAEGADHA